MLKQICRCCSPFSLHALTLEAAAPLRQGGGWCEYVKQRLCEFPCTYLLLLLCSLKPLSTVLYLEMCRCEAASAAVVLRLVGAFLPNTAVSAWLVGWTAGPVVVIGAAGRYAAGLALG